MVTFIHVLGQSLFVCCLSAKLNSSMFLLLQLRPGRSWASWWPCPVSACACWTPSWKSSITATSSRSSSRTATCAFALRSDFRELKRYSVVFNPTPTDVFMFFHPTEVPLGRRNQKPFPQCSCERASRWLRESRWVNPPPRPPQRDQSPCLVCVTGPQLHSQFTQFVVGFTSVLHSPGAPEPIASPTVSTEPTNKVNIITSSQVQILLCMKVFLKLRC